VNAELGLTVATTRACTPLLSDPSLFLSLPVCLGAELGRMEGVGHGVPTTRSRATLWIAPRVEAGLSWTPPRTRLSFEMNLGAIMPLNRDEYGFDRIGTVHQPERLAGRLGMNLNLAFD
jgi:hypothetical protein